MKRFVFCAAMATLLFLTGCGYEVDPRTLLNNRRGLQELKDENPASAQNSFIEALGVDPFISELHINLGLTYQALRQGDQALQSYEAADRWAHNEDAAFVSRFNQGALRAESKNLEEALAAYQRALQVRPDSMEVKTNIELLIQSQSQSGEGEKQQNQEGSEGQQSDQQNQGQGQDQNQQQDPDSQKDESKDDEQKKDPNKPYQSNQQYKPREFEGDLSESDVKKILGELKQQEQKIRGQFHRGDTKEQPREKDW